MSAHWMDDADARLVAALSQSREIARGLAGMAEPPIHAQESEREPDCRDLAVGLDAAREVE
jgi:hypothetical protein